MRAYKFLFFVTLLAFSGIMGGDFVRAESSISSQIGSILSRGPAEYIGAHGHGYTAEQVDKILNSFYQARQLEPVWVSNEELSERGHILVSFLEASAAEGLNPKDYRIDLIKKFMTDASAAAIGKLDILLTMELAHYVGDVRSGRLDPKKIDEKLFASARSSSIDVVSLTKEALAADDLRAFLHSQAPQHRYYQEMRPALSRYRAIARSGGWPLIPEGPTLKQGINDARVALVKQRLAISGDYPLSEPHSTTFGAPLEAAVKNFQVRHYLTADGAIGKRTLAAMNVSAEQRVRQLIVNMERWRWLSREIKGKQVFVNIAGYHLVGTEDEEIVLRMPVIVGKKYHMTPVFSDLIAYAEFNPYWNVTSSIAKNEYLPKLRKDPKSLAQKNIRVFSGWKENAPEVDPRTIDWKKVSRPQMSRYRLRQDPGPRNALGTVKFIFPNSHNVYIHDTANHSLFAKEERTLSHGCVRASKPHELAVHVLGEDNGWNLSRVKEQVASKERKVVNLKEKMPVHILYRTAVALEDQTVFFGEDIYGRDALLEKAFF